MGASTVLTIASPSPLTLTIPYANLYMVGEEIAPYQKKDVSESGKALIAQITTSRDRVIVLKLNELPYRSSNGIVGFFTNSSYKGLYEFITSASYASFMLNIFSLTVAGATPSISDYFSPSDGSVRYWGGIESCVMGPTERFNGELRFRVEV
jgi:hypothetical protein